MRARAVPVRSVPDRPAPRILIVDDSVVARAVMTRTIEATSGLMLAAALPHVRAALDYLRDNEVEGIVLDIEMPGVDGLTALPELIRASGGAAVLIVSSSCVEGADVTVQALALGAADTLVKPGIGNVSGRFAAELEDKLAHLFDIGAGKGRGTRSLASAPPRTRVVERPDTSSFDVVAIGASTGGIHALHTLLSEIPATFTPPILITQHLPDSFMPYFAAQLAALAHRPCVIAEDRMRIRPGQIMVAPGMAHLRVVSTGEGAAIRLSNERARSGCTPSVDPMFESVAAVFGARALGVVLSGMGRDGSFGARALAESGGCIVAQDQASSVVWGMPGAVAQNGTATALLPPSDIGRLIASGKRPC